MVQSNQVKKAMKSRGGLLPRFYFFALLSTLHRSPLSECLEQAKDSAAPSTPPPTGGGGGPEYPNSDLYEN